MDKSNDFELSEKIYILQPVLNEEYRALEKEAVSLIESVGAVHAGISGI